MAPISAEFLGASYCPVTSTLKLYAKGEVGNFCLGEVFNRDPFVGGLLFSLEGYWEASGHSSQAKPANPS